MLTLIVMCAAVALGSGLALAKNIVGTNQSEEIRGTNENDDIEGLGGDDTIQGRLGSDIIIGGEGNDDLWGGTVDQTAVGGNDVLRGGQGKDGLIGGLGADELLGGADNDFLSDGPELETSVDNVYGMDGSDNINTANVPASKDIVSCGSGVDTVVHDSLDEVAADCEVVDTLPSENIADGTLQTSTDAESQITGVYEDPDSSVSFSGEYVETTTASAGSESLSAPELGTPQTSAHVDVNGLSFTFTLNGSTNEYKFDAPEQALSARNRRELEEAGRALARRLNYAQNKGTLPREQEVLMGALIYISEAPAAHQFNDATETITISEDSSTTPASTTTTVEQPSTEACLNSAQASGNFSTMAYCYQHDNDGTQALGCDTRSRTQYHDAQGGPPSARHCFGGYSISSGPCSNRCKGQCGPNCNDMFATGGYFRDCLDHDECALAHDAKGRGADDNCGDEYDDARGDFLKAVAGFGRCRDC